MLTLLGASTDDSFAAFANGSATDGRDYPDIAALRASWDHVTVQLQERLAAATDEQMARPSGSVGPHGEKTIFDEVIFLAWHEAYHLGTIGAIRPALGLRPTAELVMEASSARQSA